MRRESKKQKQQEVRGDIEDGIEEIKEAKGIGVDIDQYMWCFLCKKKFFDPRIGLCLECGYDTGLGMIQVI